MKFPNERINDIGKEIIAIFGKYDLHAQEVIDTLGSLFHSFCDSIKLPPDEYDQLLEIMKTIYREDHEK